MMRWLRSRLDREDGFTLVELMVVVLIIAILIAIAIPTFLGARQGAQDRAAQSDVRNAFTAEKTYYTNNEVYTATAADLEAIEPSLNYVAAGSADTDNVGLAIASAGGVTAQAVVVLRQSEAGDFFGIADYALADGAISAGTYRCRNATLANIDTPSECVTVAATSTW